MINEVILCIYVFIYLVSCGVAFIMGHHWMMMSLLAHWLLAMTIVH